MICYGANTIFLATRDNFRIVYSHNGLMNLLIYKIRLLRVYVICVVRFDVSWFMIVYYDDGS